MESKEELKHAKLPEFFEQQSLAEMLPGETVAARCPALKVTKSRNLYLHPGFEAYEDWDESHPLLIKRRQDGCYEVDATLVGDYRWGAEEDVDTISSQYGVDEQDWIIPIEFYPKTL